jgi:hypothetical protein
VEDIQLLVLSGLGSGCSSRDGTPRRQPPGGRTTPASPRAGPGAALGALAQRLPSLRTPFASQAHNRLEAVASAGSYEVLQECGEAAGGEGQGEGAKQV